MYCYYTDIIINSICIYKYNKIKNLFFINNIRYINEHGISNKITINKIPIE